MLIKKKNILKFSINFLKKTGLNRADSELISNQLIRSDMCNHFSHGVNRLLQYFNGAKKKIYKISAKPKQEINEKNFSLVNGHQAFGQIVMDFTCKLIIKKNTDIGITAVKNAGHIGRLSDYCDQLAKEKFISLIFCNGGGPNTSIFPISKRLFGTNPFAFGMPISKKKNFIVDFSTSKLAEGKINLAVLNKQKLFGNPIVSKKGKLSNDPNKLYDGGALIPFGEIKGSAFLLVNEIIGGLLFSPNNPFKKNYLDGNNCLIITMKKSLFNFNKNFLKDFELLEKQIKKSKRIYNYRNNKIFLPGEIEKINFEKSKKYGINYNHNIILRLNNFAKKKLKFETKNFIKF